MTIVDPRLSKNRLSALMDGIFAIAMTILILGVTPPSNVGNITQPQVINYLISIIPEYISFIISFLIISILWLNSHAQFKYITNINSSYLWLSIYELIAIVSIPLTTAIFTSYGNFTVGTIPFNINLLVIGIINITKWNHLVKNNLLIPDISKEEIDTISKSKKSFIIIPIISMIVSVFIPLYCGLVYFLIFIQTRLNNKFKKI
ncbi:hypothetical protein MARBORIA2_18580 [Methanobrevibacter arboriphilus]|jgi:uncharacterized membrane protein|uniref:Uncharacterized protein n=1 Tax=Methanobrevibacter arboriphilus TaxID=39441 RepID=A0ACA8R4F9_METAZ|nr:TMEM175 family protein [Methanobrevibacter arboriphilus]MCC7562664.1 DUF1211 domain-containing protein [Methanobrevibacter arboriphilus]BBL61755.1 hypothetical protein MarbSA_07950 [Methanobrevibacter arboriphilus]GLI12768.1 hypothetical protein MARBORIA2_18580 [Methanobrevibacter arboriphilus]